MQEGLSSRTQLGAIYGVAMIAIIAALLAPPVAQDLAYHNFVDNRTILGVPNFWNVVSNVPFVFVGIAGLFVCMREPGGMLPALRTGYLIFFAGVGLVALGSGWYHLYPSNVSLVWDRLPMTLGFMAFFSVLVGEYISPLAGRRLLLPLLIVGVCSVFYWDYTELQGRGDLRLYALVQFLPMLLIPLILLMFPPALAGSKWIWFTIFAYAGSKLTEFADGGIYALVGLSGHSIKHLLAALGALFFLLAVMKRRPVGQHDQA